jgi:hypothetical protein
MDSIQDNLKPEIKEETEEEKIDIENLFHPVISSCEEDQLTRSVFVQLLFLLASAPALLYLLLAASSTAVFFLLAFVPGLLYLFLAVSSTAMLLLLAFVPGLLSLIFFHVS